MTDEMSTQSTLSSRGLALASQPSYRAFATPVIDNMYDPKDNPNGIINLGAAENYAMLPWMSDFTNKHFHATPNLFSYDQGAWGSSRLRAALAKHMNRYFHPVEAVNPDDLLVANGCMSLCEMLGFSIFSPGDGILISRPCYGAFESDFGTRAGVKCVYAAFNGEDQFSPKGAVQGYENTLQQAQATGTTIRALLVCHPHNPLGQSYPPQTLIALMQFCEEHKIHLISDEIYALSTYTIDPPHSDSTPPDSTVPFRSILTIPNRETYIHPDRLHLLYGMSKDLAGGGLRIGTLYTRNSELWRCLSAMNQFHWIPGPADALATAMLEDEAWLDAFLAESRRKLSETSTLTRGLLREKGISIWEAGRAGFFLWVDLRAWLAGTGKQDLWEAEREVNGRFTECGVFLSPGESMKAEEAGWFRVVFSYDEETLREGLGRMFKALEV
jgi:1-aminocyclopropane-1-carboxylate synthase